MAIVNRDLDSSEQKRVVNIKLGGTVTGSTYLLHVVPSQSRLVAAVQAAEGISGSPVHSLWLYRFNAGAGLTNIVLGSTIPVTAYGTSGAATFSVSAAGMTNPLQAGDALVLFVQGANSAVSGCAVGLAIQALQDIRSSYGS